MLHCLLTATILFYVVSTTESNRTPSDTSPRKIVLLHLHNQAHFFRELGALTLSNKRRYAARHSYELAYHTPSSTSGLWSLVDCDGNSTHRAGACYKPTDFSIDARAPTFGKIKLARAACVSRPGYWMLWSDADAMIINQTIPLEDVIDDAFDIAVSADWLMINAGVILLKCTPWAEKFLSRVYEAREFDSARALDQSAFQHFFDIGAAEGKLKYVPKHVINVYPEEYRPGDFLLHMAGKLYEATTLGATAIAHQFDILSNVEDVEDVAAFFTGHYFLNMYSGICQRGDEKSKESECPPDDERRLKLVEPIGFMSSPKRYRHVAMRYYWMQDWTDRYDVEGWNNGRKVFDSSARAKGVHVSEEETHDEL